jgi:hypothetical protein
MMDGEQTDFIFLKGNDALAVTINHKAILLFRLLENFDAASLDIDDHFTKQRPYYLRSGKKNR